MNQVLNELARVTEGPSLFAPEHHWMRSADFNGPRLARIMRTAHERQPQDFEALLGTVGVGPAAVRSLSLLAELIYDAPARTQ